VTDNLIARLRKWVDKPQTPFSVPPSKDVAAALDRLEAAEAEVQRLRDVMFTMMKCVDCGTTIGDGIHRCTDCDRVRSKESGDGAG